jgi:hypothetical protein
MHFDVRARVVFCDTLRREDNGKLLFIGTYLDDYVVPTLPFNNPGMVIHVTITFDGQAKRIPTYVRMVVPGYTDERMDPPFHQALEQMANDGRSEVSVALVKPLPPFRIAEKTVMDVIIGDDKDEEVIGRLHVRTAGDLLAATEFNQVNVAALDLFVGYCSDILHRMKLGDAGDLAAMTVLHSLVDGKTGFKLNDDDQPVWIVAGARRMWVLYTQPWHAEAAFDLRRRGHPVKFREMDRNAVGRLLELDKSEEFVDPQAHVVTAKKQELVH